MFIKLTPSLCMKIKHLWQKSSDGNFYYKRRIPKDIAELMQYSSTKQKFVCLFTKDKLVATRKALKLGIDDDAEWERLRTGKSISVRDAALELLNQFGVSAMRPKDTPEEYEWFSDHLERKLGPKGEAKVEEDGADPADLLPPIEAAALRIVRGEFLPMDALALYFKLNGPGKAVAFQKIPRIAVAKLIEHRGDRHIRSYNRSDVNELIDAMLKSGNGTSTVRRQLNSLQTIFGLAIREKELHCLNPFEKAIIPGEGDDVHRRQPFGDSQQATLRKAVEEGMEDDLLNILGLLLDTGARLAEIVGLRVVDVVLETEVPHIQLRHHAHRRLKNDDSIRDVPLFGAALAAVTIALLREKKKKSSFLFSRYASEMGTNAQGASATLNKRLKRLGIDLTCHSLRHTMRDRLRGVQCPKEIADRIGGWATEGVGVKYGNGYPLVVLAEWLGKTQSQPR